jgi:hypothetical protein
MSWSLAACMGELEENGYSVIPGAVPQERVRDLLASMHALSQARPALDPANAPFLNRGHDVLYNLQREDVKYPHTFTRDPRVMDVLKALLNDVWYKQIEQDRPNFIMRSLIGRSSGKAALPLHLDSFIPSSGKLCYSAQIALVLETQNPERGCTIVVPGSHRSDAYADQSALANAIPIISQPGDIVIWDSRLWHGALPNTTNESRWALIGTFTRWWIKQNFDMAGTLPQHIYDALDDDERVLFGYCSLPPRSEYDRTDIKTGHAHLKPRVADYQAG